MQIESRLEDALRSNAPRARLSRLMGELLEQGCERGEIFTALDDLIAKLRAAGRHAEEELILEARDGFTGWCNL